MAQTIKVGAVSYLNTKPLIYGFEQGMMADQVELIFDYPANIATRLLNRQIDIGLVPVAVIPSLENSHIIADHCIGCNGEVASVCLFSDVPLEEIGTILLDYQSKTSVRLLKILLAEQWNITPLLIEGHEHYEKDIRGNVAGLVIGDRAFRQRQHSKYIYDLGSAWKAMTGLPFVFAAWVSNDPFDASFKKDFNNANAYGLNHLPELVRNNPYPYYDMETYYTRNISYQLDEEKKKGLQLFLDRITQTVL